MEEKPKRKVWKSKVVSLKDIPEEYWILDIPRMDAIANSSRGQARIPGVEFIEIEEEWKDGT